MSSLMNLHSALSDPRRYLHEIDKLHAKHALTNRLYELRQEGVCLAAFSFDRRRLARILAKSVSRGKYELKPAKTRHVPIGNKVRLLYDLCLTDLIVHGVVSTLITVRRDPKRPLGKKSGLSAGSSKR